MSSTISADRMALIHDALYRGRKIPAIKLYREETGAGLAESKYAIDELEAELRAAAPEKFVRHVASKGAVILILACHCILVIAFAFLSAMSVLHLMHGGKWTSVGIWFPWIGFVWTAIGASNAFRSHLKVLLKR